MEGQGPPGYLPPPSGGPDDHSYAGGGSGGGGGFRAFLKGEPPPYPMGTLAIAAALRLDRRVGYSVPAISYGNYEYGFDLDVAPILGRHDGYSLGFRLDLTGERRTMVEKTLAAIRGYRAEYHQRQAMREALAPEAREAAQKRALGAASESDEAYNDAQVAWRTTLFGNLREYPELNTILVTGGASLSRLFPRGKPEGGKPVTAFGVQAVAQGHHARLPGNNHSAVSGGARVWWQNATPWVQSGFAGTELHRWTFQVGVEYVSSNIIYGGDVISGYVRLRSRGKILSSADATAFRRHYWEYSAHLGKGPDDRVFGGLRVAFIFGVR